MLRHQRGRHPLHRLRIDGTTELGTQFTLALLAQNAGKRPARLFIAYNGDRAARRSGSVATRGAEPFIGRDGALHVPTTQPAAPAH